MLDFQDFFAACTGLWITERTYHSMTEDEVERSHTEFRVHALTPIEKQQILSGGTDPTMAALKLMPMSEDYLPCPGFAIAFDTLSEKGEAVSMSLKALFVPDAYVHPDAKPTALPLPIAAQIAADEDGVQGFYLRDQGYSEAGAIAGRFTYQPVRQTLEMTTYYRRSVAVDQMRFLAPDVRLRTIVTYQRPSDGSIPTVIDLVGFGVERKHADAE
ncbi:MAG: phycobiliprotein lyase [Leptolyngbyaceae cyanobacterium SL_7_1]|nr:phycobiliprotein lyase [Leptolyngbyaceae cyanobacterium SL_7_1]